MKAIAVILSLLVMVLSIAPCADAACGAQGDHATELAADHHDHDAADDLCSPLCVCQCCHSHTVISNQFIESVGTDRPSFQPPRYTALLASGFKGAVLQPPQV